MIQGAYLPEGTYFQHAEFLLNVFLGVAWIRPTLYAHAIYPILLEMFVQCTTIFLSCRGMSEVNKWGTYRTKYFFEALEKWPMEKVVQAEVCMDIMMNIVLIKALEELEKKNVGKMAPRAGKRVARS
ncbi:unnamed protein product [Caenorhabditis sp. 36 PRJEB53466]|nr:unnamed protein product [Caenorhabditis sp. 36 PRJEB53466]